MDVAAMVRAGRPRQIEPEKRKFVVDGTGHDLGNSVASVEMTPFSTEFPVRSGISQAEFVAQIVAWLRGIENSKILDEVDSDDVNKDSAYIKTNTGEELRVSNLFRNDALSAVGFRHDIADDRDRIWRTEGVIRYGNASEDAHIFRLRTQCIAKKPGAYLDSPRKPYLIKSIISDMWGSFDGSLQITDNPFILSDDDVGLEIADRIVSGVATTYLPVLYVSSIADNFWSFDISDIERLAFDLGGVCHVVLEPNRQFSFRLKDKVRSKNVYGGTFGLFVPTKGLVRKFYRSLAHNDTKDLYLLIRETALYVRGQMPSRGWDWAELQENLLRQQRERDRARLSAEEISLIYDNEISILREQIEVLQEKILQNIGIDTSADFESVLTQSTLKKIGPEIYEGEFLDRVKMAIRELYINADNLGLDKRSKEIFGLACADFKASDGLSDLVFAIDKATVDGKSLADKVSAVLSRHGYRMKSEKNHIRLDPLNGYIGLDAITLVKTPSDIRSAKNTKSQIEGTVGITRLKKLINR